MRIGRGLVPCLLLIALLLAAGIGAAAPLTGRVADEAGVGLAARVVACQTETRQSAVGYTKPDGTFSLEVPDGTLKVWVTHGPEWTIAETTVEPEAATDVSLVLRRLIDMSARGYYGADFHMHSTHSDGKQPPAEVAWACQAEGLQVAALTDHWAVAGHEEWLAQQTPGFLPLRGQENSTGMGHVLGVNTATLTNRPEPMTAAGMLDIITQIQAQGGFAIVAHPNVPGMNYQTPEVRDYDALEILNGSVPPYGPVFDFVQGVKAWHTLLLDGRRVPVVGNSDCHDVMNSTGRKLARGPAALSELDARATVLARLVDYEKILVPWAWKAHSGAYRTYLQLDALSPEGVQAAVRAGRGFVTSGPLLLATLDGQAPGGEVALAGRESVTLKAEMYANRPLEKLVVVVNGQAGVTMGGNAAQIEVMVPVKAGDWVTAELYGPWPEFATTNAWYVK